MKKSLKIIISIVTVIAVAAGGIFAGAEIEKRRALKSLSQKKEETSVSEKAKEPAEQDVTEENTDDAETENEYEDEDNDIDSIFYSDEFEKQGKTIGEFLCADREDFDRLGTNIYDEYSLINMIYNGYTDDGFDYKKSDTLDAIKMIVYEWGTGGFYRYYFGAEKKFRYTDKADPYKRFGASEYPYSGIYYKYSEESVNWIVKNVFNINPVKVTDFKKYKFCEESYNYQGSYYFQEIDFDGSRYVFARMNGLERLKDGRYKVDVINYTGASDSVPDYASMIVGLKLINGLRIWTVYNVEPLRRAE